MKEKEVFAVEELIGHECTAILDNEVQFIGAVVEEKNGRFILHQDITAQVKKILKEWGED